MRYHYEKPDHFRVIHGDLYFCQHPLYNSCTLYRIGNKGLAVIQQRFNPSNKTTYWTGIDQWLIDDIYNQHGFLRIFNEIADAPDNDIYPTITVRQLMWRLRMKPIPKQRWETVFDRRDI